MTSWPDARRIAHSAATALPGITLPLTEAAGLTLVEDLRARSALPSFDAAAMDGWAVRGPGPWAVLGRLLAGDLPWPALGVGEAVEIATGAIVPFGCDRVSPYEQGLSDFSVGPAHIRAAGEECQVGDLLLPAGVVVTSAAVGLAAATGHDHLRVRRWAEVSVLVTGSELLVSGLPEKGRIRDAVGPLLVPALRRKRVSVLAVEHLADDGEALRSALVGARGDVVLTSGASSRGPADHLLTVLAELGADVLIEGVDVKPGHPQVLARLPHGPLLVGLPGNPLAALAGFVVLVEPVLAGLAGQPLAELARLPLGASVEGSTGSYRLVPVRLRHGTALPTGHGGAAMLRGAAVADAFALLAPGAVGAAGDEVQIVPLA